MTVTRTPYSLRLNFLWALAGNGFAAFCMWLLTVILTKLGRPEDVGLYAVASAIGLPVSILFSLKLQLVQITDARREYQFGHYMALRLLTTALVALVTAVIGFLFYPPPTARVIAVFGAGYGLMAYREIYIAVMQKSERMDKAAVSRFLQNILVVLFFWALFYRARNLTAAALGMIAARLLSFVFYDIPVCRKLLHTGSAEQEPEPTGLRPRWEWKKLLHLAFTALPLGLVGWLGTLFTSIPRLVMDAVLGKEQLGYFAAVSSLLVVGNLFISAVGQSVTPRLSRYFVENHRAYRILVIKLLAVLGLLGISGIFVSVFFGRWILTCLFTAEYAAYTDLLVWVMAAAMVLFVFSGLNIALTATRRFVSQIPICAAAAAVTAVVSFWAIPRYGILAGAWSQMACYITGSIVCAIYLLFVYQKRMQTEQLSKEDF